MSYNDYESSEKKNSHFNRRPYSHSRGNYYQTKNRRNSKDEDHKKGENNKKKGGGFSRPGPFGFKPKPIPTHVQMIANPFGFASHNVGRVSEPEEEKKEEQPKIEAKAYEPKKRLENQYRRKRNYTKRNEEKPVFKVPTFDDKRNGTN